MTWRGIEGIYQAPQLHMVGDGFRVAGYFSEIRDAARKLSPFLLLDYHPTHDYPATSHARGVGVHPHRGFETVTIAWKGSVAHHDSTGAGGIIGPGDVQWMTAASGILHKEYHEKEYAKRGGPFQMAQLWVNLPRAHKMGAPRYQSIGAGAIARVALPDEAGLVRVIAGELQGARGPAQTFTPIDLYDVRLAPRGRVKLDFPASWNAALLVMEGDASANGVSARTGDFVVLANDGTELAIEAGDRGAQLLVMAGEPIAEPVVQYGPFVMNSRQEIVQAFADFESGKFGRLTD